MFQGRTYLTSAFTFILCMYLYICKEIRSHIVTWLVSANIAKLTCFTPVLVILPLQGAPVIYHFSFIITLSGLTQSAITKVFLRRNEKTFLFLDLFVYYRVVMYTVRDG